MYSLYFSWLSKEQDQPRVGLQKNVINEGFTFFCCKIENHLAAILVFEKFRKFTEIFVDTYIKYRNCFLADEKFTTPIRKLRRICDPPYY